MRTFAELVARAFNISSRAQPGVTANDEELVDVLNGRLQMAFDVGRQANPWAFLARKNVNYRDGGWERPTDAQMVLRIVWAETREVAVVPFDQQDIEPGLPCVYRVGNQYHLVGHDDITQELGPGTPLTFFYSRLAKGFVPNQPQAVLDELYPHGHERLLALGMATYMAKKDGRSNDASAFDAEIAMETERLQLALGTADLSARKMGTFR